MKNSRGTDKRLARALPFITLLLVGVALVLLTENRQQTTPPLQLPQAFVQAQDSSAMPVAAEPPVRVELPPASDSQAPEPAAPAQEPTPVRPADSEYLTFAETMVNQDAFVAALMGAETIITVPAESRVDAQVAQKLHRTVTHVMATQLLLYDPDGLTPEKRERDSFYIGTKLLLESLMPDLSARILDGTVKASASFKHGARETRYGLVRGGTVCTFSLTHEAQLKVNMRKGPWILHLVISRNAVSDAAWKGMLDGFKRNRTPEFLQKWDRTQRRRQEASKQ